MSISMLYFLQGFFFVVIFMSILEIQALNQKHFDKIDRELDDLINFLKNKKNYWEEDEFLNPPTPNPETILDKE